MISIDEINQFTDKNFSRWGVNKRQEITRLLYEILKTENTSLERICAEAPQPHSHFPPFKHYLIKRRYPNLTNREHQELATQLRFKKILSSVRQNQCRNDTKLEKIYVEKGVVESELARRIQGCFPAKQVTIISSYKEFCRSHNTLSWDYDLRAKSFFIVESVYGVFERCPCTKRAVNCGYNNLNLGQGCPYNCHYCFLQGYVNSPGIVFLANVDEVLSKLDSKNKNLRIGSGQFTDSLVYDHFTNYSKKIIEFFRPRPFWIFEFKTKSSNVDNLLSTTAPSNVYVGWSINPKRKIEEIEPGTASLEDRLNAARKCQIHGYKLTLHFDPIFFYDGWKKDYKQLLAEIAESLDMNKIAWISLGTFRFTPSLKQVIELRFPTTRILNEYLRSGFDGKIRYPEQTRVHIYKTFVKWIEECSTKIKVYLCMESPEIWKASGLTFETKWFK